MTTQREREEFIARFCQLEISSPLMTRLDAARLLLRHAKTHKRLKEESCNGHPMQGSAPWNYVRLNKLQEQWDARIAKQEQQVERRITEILKPFGMFPYFRGDPRGCTVHIFKRTDQKAIENGNERGMYVPQ